MNVLALCSCVFLVLLTATVSVALSKSSNFWLTSRGTTVAVSFVLTSALGFVLTNHLLEIPNPIVLTVTIVLAGAFFLELAQLIIVKQKASLMDILFVMLGSCLFVLARYVMHTTGMHIIDQFEVFLD